MRQAQCHPSGHACLEACVQALPAQGQGQIVDSEAAPCHYEGVLL
jgi:hypothetical protein